MIEENIPDSQKFTQIMDLIQEKQNILITTHINPDGDAIGSSITMYSALKKMGKKVDVICADPLPSTFQFLTNSHVMKNRFENLDLVVKIKCEDSVVDKVSYNLDGKVLNLVITPAEGGFALEDVTPTFGTPNYDLIITLDTPELEMLGDIYAANKTFFAKTPIVNIDHHRSNANFGTVNLINIAAPSTGEIIFAFFGHANISIDPDMATALLTAIVTDTGSFQHLSTTSNSFLVASELMELGGKLQTVIDHVYRIKSVSTLKLWGRVLSRLKHDEEGAIVWATVNQQDFRECNAKEEQAEGALNDLISGVPRAKVALLLYEYPDGTVRGSIRTANGYNASQIAALFGGGGHRPAAGFRLADMTLPAAEQAVLKQIKEFLSKQSANVKAPMTPEQIIDKIGTMMEETEKITKPS